MKFNPVDQTLYTDEGTLIKRLYCPKGMSWSGMAPDRIAGTRLCTVCDRHIIDTAGVRDQDIVAIVRADPATCLKVDLNQDNIRVVHGHG